MFLCVQCYYESGSGDQKMLVQGWTKIVSFAQFDSITNCIDGNYENTYAVFMADTNWRSIAVRFTWSVRFGLCSIYHDIVQ